MNRNSRRKTERAARKAGDRSVSSHPTTAIRWRCIGLHDGGCPEKAQMLMAIGTRPADGLSLGTLQSAVRAQGWALGVSRASTSPVAGEGAPLSCLDPLCPPCARALAGEITRDGKAPITADAARSLSELGLIDAPGGEN